MVVSGNGHPICHRVVDVRESELCIAGDAGGGRVWRTQASVPGVVRRSARRGRWRSVQPVDAGWRAQQRRRTQRVVRRRIERTRGWLGRALASLQGHHAYRRVGRLLASRRIGIAVLVPVGALFWRCLRSAEPVAGAERVRLHACVGRRPAGFLDLARTTRGWRVSDVGVRARFRGLGVADQLLRRALELAAPGAPIFECDIRTTNRASMSLFASQGFEVVDSLAAVCHLERVVA